MCLDSLNVDNRTDTTVIVLVTRIVHSGCLFSRIRYRETVEGVLLISGLLFHNQLPFCILYSDQLSLLHGQLSLPNLLYPNIQLSHLFVYQFILIIV